MLYEELYHFSNEIKVINTHAHHMKTDQFKGFNLTRLINQSYVGWIAPAIEDCPDDDWFKGICCNSFYIWLQKGTGEVYGIDGCIDKRNYKEISDTIIRHHTDPDFHKKILVEKCGYEAVIQDSYWEPGDHNNSPELFQPTYRVNMFFYGYSREACDHSGTNPIVLYGLEQPADLNQYVDMVYQCIEKAKTRGCVALKCALTYDRGYDIELVDQGIAEKSYNRLIKGKGSSDDEKFFQDYLFCAIIRIAADLNLPVQCHTGLSILPKSRAILLNDIIKENPKTKFVLFHGSYPYLEDIMALCHTYKNVYPDLCWLPLISTEAAKRFVAEILDVTASDTLCWGCDTWTGEESMGALLAARYVLCTVLSEKVQNGLLSKETAFQCLENILRNNAQQLYFKNPANLYKI